MSLQLHMRKAEVTDTTVMRTILWKTWIATYGPFIPPEDLRSYFEEHYGEAAIERLLRDPCVEGHIAAWDLLDAAVMITRWNASEGRFYVSSLYVLPEFQGRGIGKAMLARAADRARAAGVNKLWLGVMVQNTQALAWYRALGFSFDEELPFHMGKTPVTHLIGSLDLRAFKK